MNKEYTPEQRRDLAQKLRGIYQLFQSIDPENIGITEEQQEDILFDLDDAIFALSPAFAEQEASELEAALNSPETDAFMEEMKKDPGYQQGLEEFKNLTQKVAPSPARKRRTRMAEYCRECAERCLGLTPEELKHAVWSKEPDLCEGCGEYTTVLARLRKPRFLWRKKKGGTAKMSNDDRMFSIDENLNYCFIARASDFYYYDGDNLFLREDEISRALEAARITHWNGQYKAAMLLICKLADGYRAYNKICSEFAKTQKGDKKNAR